jgi:hypothetical protein
VPPSGPKTGYFSILLLNKRGFLAAGAQEMSLENATKEFTINDQIKILQQVYSLHLF